MLQDNFVDALMNKNCIFRKYRGESHGSPIFPLNPSWRFLVLYGWCERVSNQKRYDELKRNLGLVLLYRVSREVIIAYSYVLYKW